MAAEHIVAQYDLDLKDIKLKISELESSYTKLSGKGKKAFDDTTGAAKKTGAEIDSTSKSSNNFSSNLASIGAAIGVAFSGGAIIAFGKETVHAFQEAELNAKKLEVAVKNIGKEGDVAFEKLIKQSENLQRISIFSHDDIQKAQAQLVQFGLNSKQVEELIPKILDLASATGDDLGTSTDMVIQGINGLTKGLKPLGLDFVNTADQAQNLAIITEKLGKFSGQTAAILGTSAGFVANLGNKYDDLKERIGGFLTSLVTGPIQTQTNAIEKEQQKLQLLETQLFSLNPKSEERVKLIKDLQIQYPDYLSNVDAEKVSNEQLVKAIEKINNLYILKIAISKNKEKIEEQANVTGEAAVLVAQKNVEVNKIFVALLNRGSKAQNDINKDLIKGLPLQVAINEVLQGRIKLDGISSSSLSDLSGKSNSLKKAQIELSGEQVTYNDIISETGKEQKALSEILGVTVKKEEEAANKLGLTEAEKEKRDAKAADDAEKRRAKAADAIKKERDEAKKFTDDLKTMQGEQKAQEDLDRDKKAEADKKALIQSGKDATEAIEAAVEENKRKRRKDKIPLFFQINSESLEDAEAKFKLFKETLKEGAIESTKSISDAAFTIIKESNEKDTEEKLNKIKSEEDNQLASLDKKQEQELSNKNLTESQRKAIEDKFQKQREKVQAETAIKEIAAKRKAFDDNKRLAIEEAVIKGALAAVVALANTVLPYPASLTALIPIAAETAAEIAIISARKFAKGTPFLTKDGSPAGVDTIPIMANEGEAIIPTNKNKERPGLAKAWIMGNLDEYINQNSVMPALREYVAKAKEAEQGNMANAMAASIILHNKMNAGPDEYAIGRQMKKSISGNSINIANADAIASSLAKQLNKTNNFF